MTPGEPTPRRRRPEAGSAADEGSERAEGPGGRAEGSGTARSSPEEAEGREAREAGAESHAAEDDPPGTPEGAAGEETPESAAEATVEAAREEDLEREAEAGAGKPGSTFTRILRALGGIPAFGKLLYRLLGDRRVALLDKLIFGAALAYLFVPVDLVPDWVPALGQMDDLLIVLFTLDRLLHRTDPAVLAEHWAGDAASFHALMDLLERAAGVLPGWARALLRAG